MEQAELDIGGYAVQTSCPVLTWLIIHCPEIKSDDAPHAAVDQVELFDVGGYASNGGRNV